MRIDWWTLALQAINVLILVWLLGRFLFRPVMDAIAARQAAANALIAGAEAAKEQADAQAKTLKLQNDGFLAEAAAKRTEMQAATETERQRLLAQAKAEVASIVAQGHAAIDAERLRLAAEWQEKAAGLAASMAATLLARVPPDRTTEAMIEALKARIGDLPEAERRKLAADGPATVTSPMPLSQDMRDAVTRALGEMSPDAAPPLFATDPALIAGIELRTPHIEVRNAWRADLDAMLGALKEDDHARLA